MSAVTAASDDEMPQLLIQHIGIAENMLETEDFEDGGQALRDLVRQSEAAVRGVAVQRLEGQTNGGI